MSNRTYRPQEPIESVKLVTMRFGKPPLRSSYGPLLGPPFVTKKGDPGRPTIKCSMGPQDFHNAICDLGLSVHRVQDNICLFIMWSFICNLHSSIICSCPIKLPAIPRDLSKDDSVKLREEYVPTDFVVLDMRNHEDNDLFFTFKKVGNSLG